MGIWTRSFRPSPRKSIRCFDEAHTTQGIFTLEQVRQKRGGCKEPLASNFHGGAHRMRMLLCWGFSCTCIRLAWNCSLYSARCVPYVFRIDCWGVGHTQVPNAWYRVARNL